MTNRAQPAGCGVPRRGPVEQDHPLLRSNRRNIMTANLTRRRMLAAAGIGTAAAAFSGAASAQCRNDLK